MQNVPKINKIIVSENLINLHPLIKKAKIAFDEIEPDKYGCCNLKYFGEIALRSTPGNSDRALRIMNAIFKILEKLGHKIEVIKEYREYKTYVNIGSEKVAFCLEEQVKKIPHIPTARELEVKEKWGYALWNKYDHTQSNKFILQIDGYGVLRRVSRLKWYDGRSQRIENQLNDFIRGLYEAAQVLADRRQEEAEEKRLRQEEQARLEQLRELKEAELEKVKLLEEQIADFHKSNVIRSYIEASKNKQSSPLQENLLKWAAEYANHLDPTKDFRISILDEDC